jgi:hypothetical protein
MKYSFSQNLFFYWHMLAIATTLISSWRNFQVILSIFFLSSWHLAYSAEPLNEGRLPVTVESMFETQNAQGLYVVEIPVISRDDEYEREKAFATALRSIVLRLTLVESALENSIMREALRNPGKFVESWSYRAQSPDSSTSSVVEEDALILKEDSSIFLQLSFFPTAVLSLLDNAGLPFLPDNRPLTLVWGVLESTNGKLEWLQYSKLAGALKEINEVALARRLPFTLPVLDLDDRLLLSPSSVWNFNESAILNASARYDAQSILVLRIKELSNGLIQAQSTHITGGRAQSIEVVEGDVAEFLFSSLELTARGLVDNYGVVLSRVKPGAGAVLEVTGIENVYDFVMLLNALQSLPMISDLQILGVNSKTIEFSLNTGGQLRQLIESLALDTRFKVQKQPSRDGQLISLGYLWVSTAQSGMVTP